MWIAQTQAGVLRDMAQGGPEGLAQVLVEKAYERWMVHYVRELAPLIGLEIEVETPFYLLQPVRMSNEFREALSRLLLACSQLGLPTNVFSPGAPRPPRDEARVLRFGFHTHGEAPNRWHIKDSHAPGRFYFNRSGYSGWLKLTEAQARFIDDETQKASIRPELLSGARQSKYEQPPAAADLPQGGVFFPLQMRDDTVAKHQRFDTLEALKVAAAVAGETERPLIVKRHPTCRDEAVAKALNEISDMPFVHIVNAPIEQALANADIILTANSSVGFSAVCAYKPVITFAASDYESCTFSVATTAQLREALRKQDWWVDRARYDRFLQVYYDELTLPIHDDEAWRRKVLEAVSELVRALEPSVLQEIVAKHNETAERRHIADPPKLKHWAGAEAIRAMVQSYPFQTVLDVGAGEGVHSRWLAEQGKSVTSICYSGGYGFEPDLIGDYMDAAFAEPFDAIWASHVLEHQLDAGAFLRRLYRDLKPGGVLGITVPPMKPEIVGGHVSLWNAGLLLYNLILAGFDCSEASVLSQGYNVSILVRKRRARLPADLTMDFGDIEKLARFFPMPVRQSFNGAISSLNWPPAPDHRPVPGPVLRADELTAETFASSAVYASDADALRWALDLREADGGLLQCGSSALDLAALAGGEDVLRAPESTASNVGLVFVGEGAAAEDALAWLDAALTPGSVIAFENITAHIGALIAWMRENDRAVRVLARGPETVGAVMIAL